MSARPGDCRLGRDRVIRFDCKQPAGHLGKCSPYTLRPLSTDEWRRVGLCPRYGMFSDVRACAAAGHQECIDFLAVSL